MCVKDLDAKTLSLNLPYSCYITHGEIKLVLIQKFYLPASVPSAGGYHAYHWGEK